jgi:hypothetical protein
VLGTSRASHSRATPLTLAKMQCLIFTLLAVGLTGCVMSTHDDAAQTLKPAEVPLHAFAGVYKGKAVYSTPKGGNTFGTAIGRGEFSSDVIVEFDTADNLIVREVYPEYPNTSSFTVLKEKQYVFSDHTIRF